jgi:hypothetical protein
MPLMVRVRPEVASSESLPDVAEIKNLGWVSFTTLINRLLLP